MKLSAVTMIAFCAALLGCSDSDEPLQGWKESEVEIVNEGTAPGTSRQIVVPGDATTTPMTGTNFDTSTDLDMITDEQLGLEGDDMREEVLRQEGSVAGRIDPATGDNLERRPARTATGRQTEPEPIRSAPEPSTSTNRQTAPSPRPDEPEPVPEPAPPAPEEDDESESDASEPTEKPEAEPDEEDNIQQEESLPPIVIPAPDPPQKKQPEQGASQTTTDTANR